MRPLAVLGDVRRLPQDLDDRMAVLLPHRHEHARHQREVERHVALVAVAEVRAGRRPATGSPRRAACGPDTRASSAGADLLEDRRASRRGSRSSCLRARSGTARRRAAGRRRRDRARTASPCTTASSTARVVEVQIGLVMEEAVPVVGARRVSSHVQFDFSVSVKMMRHALVLLVGVAPDVEVALRRSGRRAPRRLEPGMLIGRVVDDQLGDDADACAGAPRR